MVQKPKSINDSQFHMWRAVFALAHVDSVVSNEEIRFMAEALEDVPFTPEQKRILSDDIAQAQDVIDMFKKISDPVDQTSFFNFARKMVWADGTFDKPERDLILKLQEIQIQNTNVDDLVGLTGLELEDESNAGFLDVKSAVISFRDLFLKQLKKL